MHVGICSGFANHASIDDRQFLKEEMTQLLLANELGFESIWLTEHHFSDYSISPNPLQYLTWLAARTSTCRLGTQVVVAPGTILSAWLSRSLSWTTFPTVARSSALAVAWPAWNTRECASTRIKPASASMRSCRW